MSKSEIKLAFKDYRKRIFDLMGKKSLYTNEITKMGKKLFGDKYLGTFPQDKAPTGEGYLIINTDTSDKDGTHWIGIINVGSSPSEKKISYVFDSFGRHTDHLIPLYEEKLASKGKKIFDADKKPEQYGDSEVCGQTALAWLLTCDKYGVKNVIKVI